MNAFVPILLISFLYITELCSEVGNLVILIGASNSKEGSENTNTVPQAERYLSNAIISDLMIRKKYPDIQSSIIISGPSSDYSISDALEHFLFSSLDGNKEESHNKVQIIPQKERFILALTHQLEQTNDRNTLIYISGHGSEPSDKSDPASSSITMSNSSNNNSNLKYSELANLLKSDKGKYTKMIGAQCYGGGIHHISFNRPRTCSIANSYFSMPSEQFIFHDDVSNFIFKTSLDHISKYDVDQDGKPSLMEIYIQGLVQDDINFPMHQTSSMAFIDSILKEGAYNPEKDYLNEIFEQESNVLSYKNYKDIKERAKLEQEKIFEEYLTSQWINCYRSFQSTLPLSETEVNINSIFDIFASKEAIHLFQLNENIPKELRDFYDKLTQSAVFKENLKKAPPGGNLIPFFNYLNKVIRFFRSKNVTNEQKQLFLNLLECELSEL